MIKLGFLAQHSFAVLLGILYIDKFEKSMTANWMKQVLKMFGVIVFIITFIGAFTIINVIEPTAEMYT